MIREHKVFDIDCDGCGCSLGRNQTLPPLRIVAERAYLDLCRPCQIRVKSNEALLGVIIGQVQAREAGKLQ